MHGLDLETFLLLLRADLAAWAVLIVVGFGLAVLAWTSWRSRRVLRRCLVVSLAIHAGLVLYGSSVPAVQKALRGGRPEVSDRDHIRRIRVTPIAGSDQAPPLAGQPGGVKEASAGTGLALTESTLSLPDAVIRVEAPPVTALRAREPGPPAPPVAMTSAMPRPDRGVLPVSPVGPRPGTEGPSSAVPPVPSVPSITDAAELDRMTAAALPPSPPAPRPEEPPAIVGAVGTPGRSLRNEVRLRSGRSQAMPSASPPSAGMVASAPIPMEHVTPPPRVSRSIGSELASMGERPAVRTPAEVPRVYRSRVEPDRSARARLAGASAESERAVERALDWLARHQDDDGRWNAAIARYQDGRPVQGDRDFRAHCPVDQVCSGPCAYWEADSALTGLALLAFLGAGYTPTQGRYAETVGHGLDYLLRLQKSDGDLRGPSVVVGMYGHAMATLALCEGYALTGDVRLRQPAERAIGFLVRSRARDDQAWRYQPGEPIGDTSILGWVVMALKSAHEVGLSVPREDSIRQGILGWLDSVASGPGRGQASYQPRERPTPTMTAEAWVCRQFLDVGGPGPASDEAVSVLLDHTTDGGPSNFYYWYYATLALYQHGGEPWSRWNDENRDRIVKLQHTTGHIAGSWDPDGSRYGANGGRIYGTALAALTLEVYYRYLRLQGDPEPGGNVERPPDLAPPRGETGGP